LYQQSLAIDGPEPGAGFPWAEARLLQESQQPLGDAATSSAGPENHDSLVRQLLAQALAGGQHRRRRHAAGALDVVVEAGKHLAVALQVAAGIHRAEVFPVQNRVGEDGAQALHKGGDEGVVGLAPQPRLAPPRVEGIIQQALRSVPTSSTTGNTRPGWRPAQRV
jgi:hypothetical protein